MARELTTKDVVGMARIISKMNIKEGFKEIAKELNSVPELDETNMSTEELTLTKQKISEVENSLGVDLLFLILSGIESKAVEREIYEFIGSIIESTGDEVARMNPDKLVAALKESADRESWLNFFKNAVRLIVMK